VAGDPHAFEVAAEPRIDIEVASILVEVKERPRSSRKIAALALPQLGQFAELRQQRRQAIKIFLRCMPHTSSMAPDVRAMQEPPCTAVRPQDHRTARSEDVRPGHTVLTSWCRDRQRLPRFSEAAMKERGRSREGG